MPAVKSKAKAKPSVLVAYASRKGSTAGVAEAIGEALAGLGARVEVAKVEAVADLGPFDAVVLGSAVRMRKWLPEANAFLAEHADELAGKPVAIFEVCLTMREASEANRVKAAGFLAPVRARLRPVDEGLFGGKGKMGAGPERDYRDWDAIRAWAKGLLPKLTKAKKPAARKP